MAISRHAATFSAATITAKLQGLSHPTPPCCPSPPKWRSVSSYINFSQWTSEEGPLSSTTDAHVFMLSLPPDFISLYSPFHHVT